MNNSNSRVEKPLIYIYIYINAGMLSSSELSPFLGICKSVISVVDSYEKICSVDICNIFERMSIAERRERKERESDFKDEDPLFS